MYTILFLLISFIVINLIIRLVTIFGHIICAYFRWHILKKWHVSITSYKMVTGQLPPGQLPPGQLPPDNCSRTTAPVEQLSPGRLPPIILYLQEL